MLCILLVISLGCPPPFTFSDDGILFDEKNKHEHKWKESTFKFSYDFAYIQQKIFFEKYLSNNHFNFSKKDLENQAINYHREKYLKEKYNIKSEFKF